MSGKRHRDTVISVSVDTHFDEEGRLLKASNNRTVAVLLELQVNAPRDCINAVIP